MLASSQSTLKSSPPSPQDSMKNMSRHKSVAREIFRNVPRIYNTISQEYGRNFSSSETESSGTSEFRPWCYVFGDPYADISSHEYGRNFCAHAQTKNEDNSTSGRGARASYQTMLPEISARRSLL